MSTEDKEPGAHVNSNNFEQAKFDLERWQVEEDAKLRWWQAEEDVKLKTGELAIKRDEIKLRHDELAIKEKEFSKSKWSNPLLLAIVGLATTLLVSTVQSCSQNKANIDLERQRFESALIQKTLELPTQEKSAERFKFLLEIGLIKDDTGRIKYYVDNPKEIPLQGVTFAASESLTPGIKSGVEKSLASFQKYLSGIGFELAGRKISVNIDPKQDNNAFIENIETTPSLTLGPSVARDETAILQQYALYILERSRAELNLAKAQGDDHDSNRQLVQLLSGLADYFNCSYRNDPIVGKILGQRLQKPYLRNLDNQRKFTEISDSTDPLEAGEVWGGALWEIRNACGQDVADKMFYDVWSQVQVGDSTQKIGQRLNDYGWSAAAGKCAENIQTALTSRDMKL
jgi:hypothetical protein